MFLCICSPAPFFFRKLGAETVFMGYLSLGEEPPTIGKGMLMRAFCGTG